MRRVLAVVVLVAGTIAAVPTLHRITFPDGHPSASPPRDLAPVPFIENGGQLDDRVAFASPGTETSAYFTRHGMRLGLTTDLGTWGLHHRLVDARPVGPAGRERTPTTVSSFRGAASEWHTALRTFDEIRYEQPWPGIDLVYDRAASGLKYRFVLEPGADPRSVAFRWDGATGLSVRGDGSLRIEAGARVVRDAAPVSYEVGDGRRRPVATRYLLRADGSVGFHVAPYDHARKLVIDPKILYSGYLGGSGFDGAADVDVDDTGAAYVTGHTDSPEFPAVGGPGGPGAGADVFVAKIAPDGKTFVYCGFISSSSSDTGTAVTVDPSGRAFVTGSVSGPATGFPTVGGMDATHNGNSDVFLSVVAADGGSLELSGFLGGGGSDFGDSVGLDPAGNAYLLSRADAGFPAVIGPDTSHNGSADVAVTMVGPGGATVYSGFIGGSMIDFAGGIAVDSFGAAYVSGTTPSGSGFSTTVGPDTTDNGDQDAFVAKVVPGGSSLAYAGLIGGGGSEFGGDVAIDAAGASYVTGSTSSETGFPTTPGTDGDLGGSGDAFLVKVRPDGSGFELGTYLGGDQSESGVDLVLDPSGTIHVTGRTTSAFFSRPGRGLRGISEGNNVYVASLPPDGEFADVSIYGGSVGDEPSGIASDDAGNLYLSGNTYSTDFPMVGPLGPSPGSGQEGYVMKLQTDARCFGKPVTLMGTPGKDTLKGTGRADVIDAGDGNDTVSGKGGKDRLCGGSGKDKLKGGGGNDRLNGGKGNDDLAAGGGSGDRCKGGPGKDDGKACERGKV